jgi:hypothetical protein
MSDVVMPEVGNTSRSATAVLMEEKLLVFLRNILS